MPDKSYPTSLAKRTKRNLIMVTEKQFAEQTVLQDDWFFRGDKEGAQSILRDQIKRARTDKPKACFQCGGDIKKGKLYRDMACMWDGFHAAKICNLCCLSSIVYEHDDGTLFEAQSQRHL